MMRRISAVGAAVFVITMVVGAPPVAAEESWEMPDVTGMSLAKAEETFAAATAGSGLQLELFNGAGNQVVYNKSNWTVCNQSPSAGTTLTASSWAGIGINRPSTGC